MYMYVLIIDVVTNSTQTTPTHYGLDLYPAHKNCYTLKQQFYMYVHCKLILSKWVS